MFEITNDDIFAIVAAVFETTIGVGIEPSDARPAIGESSSSMVAITGAWDGAVIVGCAKPLATRLASAMLGVPAIDVRDDDITEALGELANIVGGNIKGMLPPGCVLSSPTVIDGQSDAIRIPGSSIVRDLDFDADASHVRVTIAERAA